MQGMKMTWIRKNNIKWKHTIKKIKKRGAWVAQ